MRIFIPLLLVACTAKPTINRACVLIDEIARDEKIENSACEPSITTEASDWAMWRLDGGVRWCHTSTDVKDPLPCAVIKLTNAELAQRRERARAESAAK